MIVDMHITTSMYVTRVCSYELWYLKSYEGSFESVPKILPRIRRNGHSLLASSRTVHVGTRGVTDRLTNRSRSRKWSLLLLSTHSLLPGNMFTFTR